MPAQQHFAQPKAEGWQRSKASLSDPGLASADGYSEDCEPTGDGTICGLVFSARRLYDNKHYPNHEKQDLPWAPPIERMGQHPIPEAMRASVVSDK